MYNSVTNVGTKPTVGVNEKNIETNILDFSGDIYGKEICVEFIKKTRDEKKFSGLDELKNQIARDKAFAIEFHRNA